MKPPPLSPEEKLIKKRAYRNAWQKARLAVDPEFAAKRNAYSKEYRLRQFQERPEEIRTYKRDWFRKNAGRINAKRRETPAKTPKLNTSERFEKRVLKSAKNRAKELGLPFSIDEAYVASLGRPDVCPVFPGICLRYFVARDERNSAATLDQIRPGMGYVRGNVRIVSFKANRLKSNMTLADIRSLLAYQETAEAETEEEFTQADSLVQGPLEPRCRQE